MDFDGRRLYRRDTFGGRDASPPSKSKNGNTKQENFIMAVGQHIISPRGLLTRRVSLK